jgi:hypothetical protein
MSSRQQDIDLEEIWTYDSTLMTHNFIPMTMDAPHVETAPLAENNNLLAKNLGVKPAINENEEAPLKNEQVSLDKNEAPPANDHEETQQENDNEPRPMRRSQRERRMPFLMTMSYT